MGCDIHMRAERKTKKGWQHVGKRFPNPYYDPEMAKKFEGDRFAKFYSELNTIEPYSGRNYDLFAILADVRNGYGFAGIDTGDGFKPIDMPRGIPKNASKKYKKYAKSWGEDGHSHSYFTVRELKEYDWHGQTTKHRGLVDMDQYKVFKKKGKPEEWCGDSSGGALLKVTNKEMDELIDHPENILKNMRYMTFVEWGESYYESTKDFVDNVIPRLEKLGDPDKVRIVFFFDN